MTGDRAAALIFLGFSIAYGVEAQSIRVYSGWENETFTARTFPTALAVIGAVVSLMLLVAPSRPNADLAPEALRAYDWPKAVAFCVLMAAYGLVLPHAGFFLATSLFLMIGYRLLGERRRWLLLAASAPVALGFDAGLRLLGIHMADPVLTAVGFGR